MTTAYWSAPFLTRLLRLAAAWLAAALLMQALQGAMVLGAGPRHAHQAPASSLAVPGHLHSNFERHHHRVDDSTVQRQTGAEDNLDAASAALALALSLMMVLGQLFARLMASEPVLRPAPAWFWSDRALQPLRRPPRPA